MTCWRVRSDSYRRLLCLRNLVQIRSTEFGLYIAKRLRTAVHHTTGSNDIIRKNRILFVLQVQQMEGVVQVVSTAASPSDDGPPNAADSAANCKAPPVAEAPILLDVSNLHTQRKARQAADKARRLDKRQRTADEMSVPQSQKKSTKRSGSSRVQKKAKVWIYTCMTIPPVVAVKLSLNTACTSATQDT